MMANKQTDPICGMELEETEAMVKFQHKGKTFYFCSLECNKKFYEMVEETSKAFDNVVVLNKRTDSKERS
jgi:YHS domain-containing protein